MRENVVAERRLYRDRNLQVVFGISLIAVLGIANITPAFPSIMRILNISGSQVGWLITAFTIPGALLSPLVGVMADRYGRKLVLVPSLFIFAIAGTACVFLRDFGLLLLARAIQGIGAATLGSMRMALIGDLYTGKQRMQAMGLNSSILYSGIAFYPLIGGALALLGWYYTFAVHIVALPVGLLALTQLRSPEPVNSQSIRTYLAGAWKHLKDLRLLGLYFSVLVTFILYFGPFFTYLAIFLDSSFGASSFVIGAILSASSVGTSIAASQVAHINRWFSLSTNIKLAFVVYALALISIPFTHNIWLSLIISIVFGSAHGASLPTLQTAVAGYAPAEYRGALMSVLAISLRLGQGLGPIIMGVFYDIFGLNATFIAGAVISLLVTVIAIAFSRKSS